MQLWPAFSFSYSGGKGQEEGQKRRKQSGDKIPHSSQGQEEGEGRPLRQEAFDCKKKTSSANKARHEQGCSANKAGSANKTVSANKAGMNKDGERLADDDSGDAHLSGEGKKKKQSLPSKFLPCGSMCFICVCLIV